MPTYEYKAIDEKGKIRKESISASNMEEAGELLQKKGLIPISIKTRKKPKKISFRQNVSLLEKISFARYLGLMLKSGISVSEGIDSLSAETDNQVLKKILNDISYGLRSGKSISQILKNYPNVFDRVFIAMVESGEASGTLGETFSYLADKLKSEYELKRQIKGAMIYPLVIFAALLAMGVLLTVFILPKIGEVFISMGIDLPLPTRILLGGGTILKKYFIFILPGIFILGVVFYLFAPRERLQRAITNFLSKMPITGNIVKRIDYGRLTRTLGILLRSGVAITEAVEISISTVSQKKIRKLSPKIKKELIKGRNLSDILKTDKVFPAFVNQMLIVGEQSGNLEEVLGEIGNYYTQEAEDDLKNIAQVVEPILILIVGVLVGAIVISIIAPIYSLIGNLQVQ